MTNVQKLKKLRVYGRFVRNLNANRKKHGFEKPNDMQLYINSKHPEKLMWGSFIWDGTPEGQFFWEGIAQKFMAL